MPAKRITLDAYRLYLFARQYPGWQGFAPDARTRKALREAAGLGLIEVNRYGQFRYRAD